MKHHTRAHEPTFSLSPAAHALRSTHTPVLSRCAHRRVDVLRDLLDTVNALDLSQLPVLHTDTDTTTHATQAPRHTHMEWHVRFRL